MTDKKSCTHNFRADKIVLLEDSQTLDMEKEEFNFCPLCGKPLKSSALDKLLLKTLGLEDQGKVLNPGQSIEDFLEAFSSSKVGGLDHYVSFDFGSETDEIAPNQWHVGLRGAWFFDKGLYRALTKALLWAATELTVEEVQELFKKGTSHDQQQS